MVKRKESVIRTIRITKELDELLQKDAKDKRLSVNALISMIMTRYAEWDRFNERFSIISLKREAFASDLETTEERLLIEVAKNVGQQVPKQFMLFWFKKLNLETYLLYLSLVCTYARFAEYELERDQSRITITLIHELGEKWSMFLKYWIQEGMKATIGITPAVGIMTNSVMVSFESNSGR